MIFVMLAAIAVLLFMILRVLAAKSAPAPESAKLSPGQQKFVAIAQLVLGGCVVLWVVWMATIILS